MLKVVALVLALQALLIALGAVTTLLQPRRAALQYGAATDPTVVVFMIPFQVVMALLMLDVAWLIVSDSGARLRIAWMLAVFSVLELGFIGVRIRANAMRGQPAWRLPAGRGVVSLRASAVSALFALVYAAAAIAFLRGSV